MEKETRDKELRILILEDIVTDAELMEYELRKGGIIFSSRCVHTKEDFLEELADFLPHLILADYSLPQFDGISALEIAKKQCPDVPFIIVSGAIGEELAIEVLKSGATDYILKNRLSRLVPSVHRALREIKEQAERKQAEEALRESEEKYRSLVESTEDSIYLIDRNYKYLFMNKKHISRMDFSGNEYPGKEYSEFHSHDETKLFVEKANKAFNTGESINYEHKSLRDGRYFLLTLSPVKKSDGTVIAVTVVSKDITEYKRMEEKLRALSLIDELTGLHNRRGLFALVEQLLKLCKRQKKGTFMLYADVDNLKEINDTFGHKEGDMALKDIANILRKNFRDADIIARIGGDEFVVIPVGTAGDNVEAISSRLQKSLEIHNAERNRSYKLSLSFGIAYYDPENPCSIDGLLTQGDELMYEQKRHKHNS
jgi:diguanylate cyclase (GGDEF)-like protein/PAS domain S-box-containing protein